MTRSAATPEGRIGRPLGQALRIDQQDIDPGAVEDGDDREGVVAVVGAVKGHRGFADEVVAA